MIRSFLQFAGESYAEMRKVVWPTKAETLQSVAGVLVMVVVMGLVLWAIDSVLLRLVVVLTGYGAS